VGVFSIKETGSSQVGEFAGISGNTWIVIVLGFGWLVSRLILQARFSDRHAHWLEGRRQNRAEILHGPSRIPVPCTLAKIQDLPLDRYEEIGLELKHAGFRSLGAFEDPQFNRAFPHLRTAYSTFVSQDGITVATVAILVEKRAWRRLVLWVRRVPRTVESLQLVTSFRDGSNLVTQRVSTRSTGGRHSSDVDCRGPACIRLFRPSWESVAAVVAAHQAELHMFADKDVGADKSRIPGDPVHFSTLDKVLKHVGSHHH
jgi:hypothetical protein